MKIRFSIKKPDKVRKSFAIIKDVQTVRDRRQTNVEDEALESINRNLKNNLITLEEAYFQIKNVIVPNLKKQANVVVQQNIQNQLSEHNEKLFTKFWLQTYKDMELENPDSTKNDILRAIKSIDPLSLATSTKEEIQNKLNLLPTKRQRRNAIRINQLLAFLGRGFEVARKKPVYEDVDYVTWEELQKILPFIPSEEVRHLAVALWGTGVRIGEAFAPGFCRLKPNDTIYIEKQLTNKRKNIPSKIKGVKNNKPHHTILLKEAKQGYLSWCSVEDKNRFRISAINQIREASKKAFPGQKHKQVSAHDLRHSYAITLLERGASLTQVAMCLGDTIGTVQMHYTGFSMTDEAIEGLRKIINA